MNNIISIGAFMSALSVIFGAFGAHALRGKVGYDQFQVYETATHYFQIHAFATLIYGLWLLLVNKPEIRTWPVTLFWVGTFIFSGSLYLITFTGIRKFGMITPIGGVMLIAAWIGFGIQAAQNKK